MKQYHIFILALLTVCTGYAQSAKIISDCTVTYTIQTEKGTGDATKTLYIKGKKTRSEITSSAFNQTTICDNKTGEAIILKEINGEKYVTKLDEVKWKERNTEWDGMTINQTNETKNILGYNCKKAVGNTKTGKSFTIFYTTDLMASAAENVYQFKNVPGFVLEYESQTAEGKKVIFSAAKINFSPVPASKFILPETGYKVL